MSVGVGVVIGVIGVFFLVCLAYAGYVFGRRDERNQWIAAAEHRWSIEVGRNQRYHVVHPTDMLQYGRAMRFMQSDRPRLTPTGRPGILGTPSTGEHHGKNAHARQDA